MSSRSRAISLLGVWASVAMAASPEAVRREQQFNFERDPAFQTAGGVQVYFDIVKAEASPASDPRVKAFQVLDRDGRWARLSEPLHVGLTRLSYVVERDVGFFTKTRLLDLKWVQRVAPEMNVDASPDGGFTVGVTPTNHFGLSFHDSAAFAPEVAALAGSADGPVLVQQNEGFARVLGWRTAEWSTTWTLHEPVGPGRTRITVLALSYLHNLPPGVLGGEARMYSETIERSLALITRLRTLPAD